MWANCCSLQASQRLLPLNAPAALRPRYVSTRCSADTACSYSRHCRFEKTVRSQRRAQHWQVRRIRGIANASLKEGETAASGCSSRYFTILQIVNAVVRDEQRAGTRESERCRLAEGRQSQLHAMSRKVTTSDRSHLDRQLSPFVSEREAMATAQFENIYHGLAPNSGSESGNRIHLQTRRSVFVGFLLADPLMVHAQSSVSLLRVSDGNRQTRTRRS